MEERERFGGKAAGGAAQPGAAALEPPAARGAPARRSAPAAPPPEESRKAEEALEAARQSRADLQRLRPVLEALAPRLAAVEDRLKEVSLPELQGQIQQMLERQARLEAHAREMDRAAKTELQRLSDLTKPLPAALEKIQEDISTARIEIKALKYEAEALNNLQEDRIRALEEAAAEKRR
jgi:chromosome segregation ATPase